MPQNRKERRIARKQGVFPAPQGLLDQALQYHRAGRLPEAEALYRQILAVEPRHADSLHFLGVIAHQQGHLDLAIDLISQAIRIKKDVPAYHNNLGTTLSDQRKFDEAIASYKRALYLKADYAEAHINLGNALKEKSNLGDAETHYKRGLALKPDSAEGHNNLGTVLRVQNKLDEALEHLECALTLKPDYAEACSNKGNIFRDQDRLEEAVGCYGHALALKPNIAEFHSNLGTALRTQGKFDEAIIHYERALALKPNDPDAEYNYALLSLVLGDFEKGWRQYEARWAHKTAKPHEIPGPLWDGGSLQGKTLLLHSEQGLGDTIQFIRYIPLIQKDGGQIIFVRPAPLAHLFKNIHGIDKIITDARDAPSYDVQAPLMSLPLLFNTTLHTIPAGIPYLQAEPALINFWRERLQNYPGVKVGVVWRGNPLHKNDRNRSMRPDDFAAFLDVPGISIINLQKDAKAEEITALNVNNKPFLNAGPDLGDFNDTAALISCLDLIISVDTSICHLAGALGANVWTLIAFSPDWRWLLKCSDTPWYPTMQLFRQPAAGDWNSVIEQVRLALLHKVKE